VLTFKLALRGLWRHRLRAVLTVTAIAFGQMMMLVFKGLSEGSHGQMIDVGVRQGSAGHVVVQAAGYQKDRAVELTVTGAEAVRRAAEAAMPGAAAVLRAYGGGLARSATHAVGILFAGVEPERERAVSDLAQHIVEGVYLGAGAEEVARAERAGADLWCARPGRDLPIRPVVIGRELGRTLRLRPCDKLVLDTQGLAEMESGQLRVVGLFETGNSELDGFFAQLPLGEARRLLHLGDGVHQVAVFLPREEQSRAAADAIRARLGDGALEVLAWDEALPELAEFIWLDDAGNYVFLAIVFLLVGIGVLNTVLMSVMERVRELGLMRALGAGPVRVLAVVAAEALLLGIFGVAAGLAGGLALHHHLATVGLDISALIDSGTLQGAGVALTGVLKSRLEVWTVALATLAVLAMVLGSAIYPAIRAARIRILEAVHHV
jgi:ABC-type lipoprotein release transport system permease subunit